MLLRRYQRFLADLRLSDGKVVTALCPNTGSMKSCSEPGRTVAFSRHPEPTRKYPYTWEMIRMDAGWVGVNTHLPNVLVERALKQGDVAEFSGERLVRREVMAGVGTRLDFCLEGPSGRAWIEVKNVSLVEGDKALFPDAVSPRAAKHMETLRRLCREGDRAAVLFTLQRADGKVFQPADAIDPAYGKALRQAAQEGVEVLAYRVAVSPTGLTWGEAVPVELS